MKNTYNNFSVIVPVLGTKKELKFAEKTIPAIIDLNPHEIIFGIDAPENQTLISTLDQLCVKKGFNRQRYVAIKRDKNWNMQLCNIMWNCITASKNDKILMTNIDSLVLSPIMIGCDIVGTLNIAAHTSPTIHYVKTLRDKIKTYCHKLIMDRMGNAWSGSIWTYRPYFLECIDFENYRRIYNGNDTFIIESIKKNKKYRYAHKSFESFCFDAKSASAMLSRGWQPPLSGIPPRIYIGLMILLVQSFNASYTTSTSAPEFLIL